LEREGFCMEKERTKKRNLRCLLFISLLIHALFVFTVFRYSFQKHAKDFFQKIAHYLSPEEIQKKKEKKQQQQQQILQALQQLQPQHKLAALKPKKSNFGWVMFDDPPNHINPEKVDIPTTIEGLAGQSITADATEEKVDNKKIKKIIEEEKDKQKPSAVAKAMADKLTEKIPAKKTNLAKKQLHDKPIENKDKRIEEIIKQQEKLDKLKDIKKSELQVKTQTRGASSIEQKPKRNIIALTKGFVENLKDEGNDPIKRDGDKSIKASFEDLKYLSYETKINWCLQAAWKQNFGYKIMRHPMEGKAVIEMVIDKYGKLVKNTLLQSSGSPELDRMIMQSTEQATPFPPLPKHFDTDMYTTGRVIQVTMSRYSL